MTQNVTIAMILLARNIEPAPALDGPPSNVLSMVQITRLHLPSR